MLARENRLLKPEDFRTTMKTGRKISTAHLVIYLKRVPGNAQARFGFVVSKAVGGAVQRNLVKRRLRTAVRTQLLSVDSPQEPAAFDLVVRALPGSAELDWNKLALEVVQATNKAKGSSIA
jgi:ribonuclease P protein component